MSKHLNLRLAGVLFLASALVALSGRPTWAADKVAPEASEARLLGDLKFLTSEQCEGRGVRTKGINLAADHIAQEFRKAGLKPGGTDGFFQPFTMNAGTRLGENNQLVLKGPLGQSIALEIGKGFTVLGFSGTGKVSAPVVFAGYGITSPEKPQYNDFDGLDVAGKVVVLLRQVPQLGNEHTNSFPGSERSPNAHAALVRKASNAGLHKAAAVIIVNDNLTAAETNDQLRDFRADAFRSGPVGIPAVFLRRSYANMMVRSVLGTDLAEIEKAIDRDLKPRSTALDGWTCEMQTNITRETLSVKNVVGVLEGAGPLANETVVIGAHYDHLGRGESGSLARGSTDIHFGADDNASGSVSVVELARRFGTMPDRKGRRLVFMTFSAEESGLLGSAYYCNNPIYPIKDTAAMVNLDMVGRLRDDKLDIYGVKTGGGFEALIDKLNEKHQFKLTKGAGASLSFGGSDHQSFHMKGIPVIFFFTGLHQQYHRPTDTWDTINVPGMRKIVDMAEGIVAHLAMVEPRPEFLKVAAPAATGTPRVAGPRLGVLPNYNDEKDGVLLDGVTDAGPAAKAGLKAGDRIVEIGGKPIKNIQAYMSAMGSFKKGDTLEVTVLRKEKQEKLKVVLE